MPVAHNTTNTTTAMTTTVRSSHGHRALRLPLTLGIMLSFRPESQRRSATQEPSSPADQSQDEEQYHRPGDRHCKTPPVPSGHACVPEQAHQESAQQRAYDTHDDVVDDAPTTTREESGHPAGQPTENDPRQNANGCPPEEDRAA